VAELRIWREGDNVYVCRDTKLFNGRIQPQHLVMRFGHPMWTPHRQGANVEPLFAAEEVKAHDESDTPQ
jgi:hypothetical protein